MLHDDATSCHTVAAAGINHASIRTEEAVVCITGVAGANSGAAATELGSSKNPIYMMQAEPTFKAQLWRTVRTLAVAFLIISGIGALFDERGLGKGILHNPDMKPQLESKTKFEDVKGVDEAKVSRAHVAVPWRTGLCPKLDCFPCMSNGLLLQLELSCPAA